VECILFDVGLFYVPIGKEHDLFMNYTHKLPLNIHPEVFGMHENADILKNQQETEQLFNTALWTQVSFRVISLLPSGWLYKCFVNNHKETNNIAKLQKFKK